jgi:hypothetical protein
MSISSILPQRSNASQIDPKLQLAGLKARSSLDELKGTLPANLIAIISDYTTEILGPNAYSWYTVLEKLNILPKKISPLPLNIHDILTSTCPIFGAPWRLIDTHTLWLIPGGQRIKNIDDLASVCGMGQSYQFLSSDDPNLVKSCPKTLRTAETVNFEADEWFIISDLLPESLNQTSYKQTEMIVKIRKKSFVNYEVPRFKYALAASLFKKQLDGTGLWITSQKDRGFTRVQETMITSDSGIFTTPKEVFWAISSDLTIGSSRNQWGHTVTVISKCPRDFEVRGALKRWDNDVGMAALWVGFSPKPSESSCAMS